jgi:hypothetical protein
LYNSGKDSRKTGAKLSYYGGTRSRKPRKAGLT